MHERLCLLTGKIVKDKKKNKSPEAAVGRAVDAYLKSIGAYMRTIKSGGTMRGGKWTTSAQGSGISDRIGVLPGGRAIVCELKAPGKKKTVTDNQINFLLHYAERGAVACVADCVQDLKIALNGSKQEIISNIESLRKKTRNPKDTSPLFP
jgi:hypothetical protein